MTLWIVCLKIVLRSPQVKYNTYVLLNSLRVCNTLTKSGKRDMDHFANEAVACKNMVYMNQSFDWKHIHLVLNVKNRLVWPSRVPLP